MGSMSSHGKYASCSGNKHNEYWMNLDSDDGEAESDDAGETEACPVPVTKEGSYCR